MLANTTLRIDREHCHLLCIDEQWQSVVHRTRRLTASIPGNQHTLADSCELAGERHRKYRPS